MTKPSTLRHSRAHRDAAKRNAKKIASHFVFRTVIDVPEKYYGRILNADYPTGVKIIRSQLADDLRSVIFLFEIDPAITLFSFDDFSPLFTVLKTERVRK